MKRSLALLAVAALLGSAVLVAPASADAWWGGPGGNFSFGTPWGGFNMSGYGGGWGGGPWGYGGGWGGGPWGYGGGWGGGWGGGGWGGWW